MLQHEQTPAEQSSATARHRVTPEELAQALAALEAHGEERAKTITIGEAVDQLNLQATPEEIWAQVQVQRQNAGQAGATRLPRKSRRGLWLALGLGSLVLFGTTFAIDEARQSTNPDTTTTNQVTQSVITPPVPQTVIETLAEVKNNGTFYCDPATADSLLTGKAPPPPRVLVTVGRPFTSQQQWSSWTFSKHDGKLYLHGYTAPRSPEAMSQGPIPIFTSSLDTTGVGGLSFTQQITLRVGDFKLSKSSSDSGDGESGIQQITVSDINPDAHFKDSW